MFRVLPYRVGSRSARALAESLGGRVLRLRGSTWRPRNNDIVINWGNTEPPQFPCTVLNGRGIRQASNKLHFFNAMRNDADRIPIIPSFWTRQQDIPDDAFPIVCRTVLAGHSGAGIVLANSRNDLVAAPLYVQYIKKEAEYRIHVGKISHGFAFRRDNPFREEIVIISEQRKVRRADHDNPNWQIRNHANGFIFQRNDIQVPECVREVARQAMQQLEIDFGAVDVIYNRHQNRAFVLEVNTAPGLEGTTVTDYAAFFRRYAA